MKFLALIATAIAVRLSEDKISGKVTAAKIMADCNKNGDKVLDAPEVVACFKSNGVDEKDAKMAASYMLKNAFIPSSNWKAVADGITAATPATVKESDVAACDTNGNKKLSYGEVKACLKKNAKVLGLKSKKDWAKAKWGLARAAQINQAGLKATLAAMAKAQKK